MIYIWGRRGGMLFHAFESDETRDVFIHAGDENIFVIASKILGEN